jgi:hypothetical protein
VSEPRRPETAREERAGPEGLSGLAGREIRGVVTVSPRTLAIPFVGEPRAWLWIHIEPRDAFVALAGRIPAPPDPRGARFEPIERAIRGARVREARVAPDGSVTIHLMERPGSDATFALSLAAEGPRANLVLAHDPGGQTVWSFRRPESADVAQAPRSAVAHPGRVRLLAGEEAIQALREKIAQAFQEDFERGLKRELNRAERLLRRREEAAAGDVVRAGARKEDRRRAEILLAHFNDIPRGASRAGLPDPYADSPGARIEISLDPALSPQDNAARLFQSAKRGERGERVAQERLVSTRKTLAGLAQARRDIASLPPKDALARLGAVLREAGLKTSERGDGQETRLGQQRAAAAPRPERPGRRPPGARKSIGPRTFTTTDGWEVWVGRNHVENDLITHRLSNPHDFWFHAIGVPGSHVILRRPTRQAVPRQQTLIEAAEIAAWFSQGRKLARVPVVYTERKFVSKPRRAKPGQAVCTRERELFVRPRSPRTSTGTGSDEREVSS